MNSERARVAPAAVALGAVAAVFTVTKAVHVDDTAHLWIAQALARDPLHASSALMNWDQVPEPIHALNVPYLLLAVFAAALRLGASAELGLHLVSAALVLVTVVLVHRFAALAAPRHALWITAAVALGPAFLPAANLMTDVPTLGIWAAFFSAMALAEEEGRESRAWQACALAAAGCLIKYASLVLVPAFVALTVWRRSWRHLRALALPGAALLAWSAYNWIAYGGVHLLERAHDLGTADRGLSTFAALSAGRLPMWVLGIGALSPFALAFATRARARTIAVCGGVGAILALAGLLLPLGHLQPFVGVNATDAVLRGIFFANGLFVVALAIRALRGVDAYGRVLAVWIGSGITLATFMAPFPAARHVLLALPALLVLLVRAFPPAPVAARIGLALTAAVGVATAISDWRRADVYRGVAASIPSSQRVWTAGHWGWQWYAAQRGLLEYAPGISRLEPSDTFIAPDTVHKQRLVPEDAEKLRLVAVKAIPGTALDFVRTVTPAGGLYYYWAAVPWTFRMGPVETFRIYEVREPSRGPDIASSARVAAHRE